MIGKNTIKLIKSLALKKYRKKEGLFLVEGDKMVAELMNSGATKRSEEILERGGQGNI